MKFSRSWLIGGAAVVLLVVLVVALAFTPAVQTRVARQVLQRQPDTRGDVGRVAIGLNSVRVRELRVLQPGLGLVLPSLEIDLPVFAAARERVRIKRLVAKGWTLDLTGAPAAAAAASAKVIPPERAAHAGHFGLISALMAQPSPAPETAAGFTGLFELLQLPVDLEIESAEIEGDILFSTTPGRPPGKAHVVITGGQLGAGREGRFTIVASAEVTDPTAPVRTLTARSVITARMDTPRSFSGVSVSSDAQAAGPKLPDGAELKIAATATRAASGEDYTAKLSSPAKTLADVKAAFPRTAAQLNGSWKLDVADSDVAPFALGVDMPAFAVMGEGTFALDQSLIDVQIAGNIDARLAALRKLDSALAVVGPLNITADFDVVQRGDITRITRLQAEVSDDKPVASVEALQGFEFNSVTGELSVADPASDLLRMTLDGLPMAWVKPFLTGYDVQGGDLRGEFAAGAREGGFTLKPTRPLTLTGLSIAQAGQPLVEALDIALRASADYTPQGWQAEIGELALRSGGVTLLTLQGKAGQQVGQDRPVVATARYEANLPALLAQPAAQSLAIFARGRAVGEFTASFNEKQEVATKLVLADLVAVTNEPLPKVTLDARVDLHEDGRIDAHAPLVVEQDGRISDLLLAAHLKPAGEVLSVDARLTSETLFVEDLQLLLAPFSAPEAETPPTKPAPAPPTDEPLWAGVTGQLALNLKKVVYSPAFTISDVAGTVKIDPASLTLDNVRALLGDGGSLKLAGGLNFEAKAAEPYALQADVALANVDPGPIFRSLDPAKSAPVEGRFDLTTRLAGRAADPAGLAETALGDLKLTSRGGTLRALGVQLPEIAGTAGKVAEIVGAAASIFGKETGATRELKKAQAAGEAVKQLGAIQFDQLNVVLERDAQNNFAIKDLTLISPLVRLVGSGQITYQPGVSVWRQPLLVNLQLGARDQLAENLRALKLLGETSDPLGYAPLVEQFRLEGSLLSISAQPLQNLIIRALTK